MLGYGPLLGIERPEGSSQETLQLANLFEHISMFFCGRLTMQIASVSSLNGEDSLSKTLPIVAALFVRAARGMQRSQP
jgi:hypothetical protein